MIIWRIFFEEKFFKMEKYAVQAHIELAIEMNIINFAIYGNMTDWSITVNLNKWLMTENEAEWMNDVAVGATNITEQLSTRIMYVQP